MVGKRSRIRRTFTPAFKRDAVRLVDEGKTATEVARNLGIARSLLQRWKDQLAGTLDDVASKPRRHAPSERVRELERRLRDVTEERDILKKRWPTLRTTRSEVPFRPGVSGDLPSRPDVHRARGLPQWVLRLGKAAAE